MLVVVLFTNDDALQINWPDEMTEQGALKTQGVPFEYLVTARHGQNSLSS